MHAVGAQAVGTVMPGQSLPASQVGRVMKVHRIHCMFSMLPRVVSAASLEHTQKKALYLCRTMSGTPYSSRRGVSSHHTLRRSPLSPSLPTECDEPPMLPASSLPLLLRPSRGTCTLARPAPPPLVRRAWRAPLSFLHTPQARAEQPALSDPLVLVAERRAGVGRLDAAKQRKGGRVPAVVFNQVRTRTRRLPPELSDAPPDSSTRRSCW